MKTVFNYTDTKKQENQILADIDDDLLGIDSFIKKPGEPTQYISVDMPIETAESKKKKSRKRRDVAVDPDHKSDADVPTHMTNQPYLDTFSETNNLLRGSIAQVDQLSGNLLEDIREIRGSKSLRKKYEYLGDLSSTASTLVSTKITAIREINKTITDSHNLELKRMKDIKMGEAQQNDDKYIMDMYNSFINTPVGAYALPTTLDATIPGFSGIGIGAPSPDVSGNLNPTEVMMRLENNPNIKTCVVYDGNRYDDETGYLRFEVMDMSNMQPISGVDKPDRMFLKDITVDKRNGVARNTNLNTSYPLIVMNDPMNMY